MSDRERYEALRRGLVGPHMQLYRESVDFRAAVDQMSQWLPEIADLVADGARWRKDRMAERLHEQLTQPSAPMVFRPEVLAEVKKISAEEAE